MKTYKQRLLAVKQAEDPRDLLSALWNYISFPIHLPNRPHQQELLEQATAFTMLAEDPYFSKKALNFQAYRWGEGKRKIFLTHGWSSKAADFTELITALREIEDVQIIAFDALGNGASEGELSNLMLYVNPLKALIKQYGMPEVLIGHSLGAMANVVALKDFEAKPDLLISITPVVELADNFTGMMNHASVNQADQAKWFQDFEASENEITKQLITKIADTFISIEQEINALDAKVGDGDAGATFASASQTILKLIDQLPLNNPTHLLESIGRIFSREAGGSSGVLMSILFTGAANTYESEPHLGKALLGGLNKMKAYGGAKVGDN